MRKQGDGIYPISPAKRGTISGMSTKLWFWMIAAASGIALVTLFAPLERTLGTDARIVYLHGAWVWVALLAFLAAALTGLGGVLTRQENLHEWSRALGRTGLIFWITFLPMSLYVMQANWNGLFLDEPRFRIPLNYAVVGILLQIGLSFFPVIWTSIANLAFGAALFWGMSGAQTVLHPDSPIFNSSATDIKIFFTILLLLLAVLAILIAEIWRRQAVRRSPA
jgi:hypothetical protein